MGRAGAGEIRVMRFEELLERHERGHLRQAGAAEMLGGASAASGAGGVGSVGDSYDNALAETINGLYKAEVIHRRGSWRSLDAVEYATLEWVDWFNKRRLLELIGNVPPAETGAVHSARAAARIADGDRWSATSWHDAE